MKGHAGKILRIDLTRQRTATIPTERYEEWIGGHGMAAALWFDLVGDKAVGGFDPRNALVIGSGLFAGTIVPAANRIELVGTQIQSHPVEWFSRSNCGGRVAASMKYAGFDCVTIEGASEKPVWVNVVDGDAEIRDASGLWGLDTYEAQRAIFREVSGSRGYGGWLRMDGDRWTSQRPGVLTIGPAGENRGRVACIIHDAGCAFGQGGYGGIWGAKNLKAISFWGSGGIEAADPRGLMEARLWAERTYGADFDNPRIHFWLERITSHFGGHPGRHWTPFDRDRRPYGCNGCHISCKPRTSSGLANEAICSAASFYQAWDMANHGRVTEISGRASDLLHRLGINVFEAGACLRYIRDLHARGILGPGRKIHTDLPFDEIGEAKFIDEYLHRMAYRVEIGDDIAEGQARAAERWGRLEEDLRTGLHPMGFWGYSRHYDARTEVYWGYASLVSARDINCHDFNVPAQRIGTQHEGEPLVPAARIAEIVAEKTVPFNDPLMMDFSDGNIYSEHMAKTVAWLMYYTTFWKQSCGLCDNAFADFVNPYGPDNKGITPDGEIRFFRALTGRELSFADTMEVGRRMWNLERAILALQGRHREMEKHPNYVYISTTKSPYVMPALENGEWIFKDMSYRMLDEAKFEEWKTRYYALEGWDPRTGWPTRRTLEGLGLKAAADELEKQGKKA